MSRWLNPLETCRVLTNGFYRVAFRTPLGTGAGVAVLQDGRMHGGNSYHSFVGTYIVTAKHVSAQIEVSRHTEGEASVMGIDEMIVTITGDVLPNGMNGRGSSQQAPGAPLYFELDRIRTF
jgi:hypothetical protein